MDIRPLSATTPGPQGLDALAASAASARHAADHAGAGRDHPARTRGEARHRPGRRQGALHPGSGHQFDRVFQVVDPNSGTVIDQLPSETALRNRAYDAAREAREAQPENCPASA